MTTKRTDDKKYKKFPIIFPDHRRKSKEGHIKRKNIDRKLQFLKIVIIICGVFIAVNAPSAYQMSRYEADVYDCSDMTEDCYDFFTSLGFNVSQVHGEPDGSDPNDYREEKGQRYVVGHRWLRFHFPWGDADFECTTLQFRDVASDWDIVWEYGK